MYKNIYRRTAVSLECLNDFGDIRYSFMRLRVVREGLAIGSLEMIHSRRV